MKSPHAAVVVLALVLGGCSTTFVPANHADAFLIEGQSAGEVRAAVVRALKSRRFATVSEEAGKINARYDKGEATVNVAVEYSDSQYLIRYMGSAGLETQKGPGGETLIDDRYASWTKSLKKAIDLELKRPAKERAQAARAQHDYEMLLQQQRTQEAEANARAVEAANAPPAPVPAPGIEIPIPNLPLPQVDVQQNTSVRRSEQSLTCCINGAKYNCPGQDAFQACLTSGPSQCTPAGRCK